MGKKMNIAFLVSGALAMLGSATCFAGPGETSATFIAPSTFPRTGSINERFQSYNIEMVEITGGRFWKPYASKADASPAVSKQPSSNQPAGVDPSLFQFRSPIDLSNSRLRKLAAALGPVYLRVSGTWANTTFFQNSDGPALTTPPKGFNGLLTRQQWKGVVDFSRAANAEIVTSFAVSAGTRDSAGVWTPNQAHQLLDYTKSVGGRIAAAEYMNEPTFAAMGGAPADYDAAAFARDFAVFRGFMKSDSPETLILGPGGVGEGTALVPSFMHPVKSDDILAATGSVFDGVSYHSYGAISNRCAAMGPSLTTNSEAALSEAWLAKPERIEEFYAAVRDRFEPGKPLWLTETAQTGCGGDRWASTFLDSFRYLNQLGGLARRGVQVQMYNTLASSDYGLLDENTYEPRPNYWAALLWRKLMGTTVLDAGSSPAANLHVYAQCLRNYPGGVALLVINADRAQAISLEVPRSSERYTLTAHDLQDAHVQLNGVTLELGSDDNLPELKPTAIHPGQVTFAPETIVFLAIPKARNASCR